MGGFGGYSVSDIVTILGFLFTIAGVIFAVRGISASNRNSSASLFLDYNESISRRWENYLEAIRTESKQDEFYFGELINLIEIGCAYYDDGAFVNNQRKILEKYLDDVLDLINANEKMRELLTSHISSPDTFEHIQKYRKQQKHRRQQN